MPITINNIHELDPQAYLQEGVPDMDPKVSGGLFQFFRTVVRDQSGPVSNEAAEELVGLVAGIETHMPLHSVTPFRYPIHPELPEYGLRSNSENTVRGAKSNADYLIERFALSPFLSAYSEKRTKRLVGWRAPIDEDYEVQVRGASGAGTFSVDFALCAVDKHQYLPRNDRPSSPRSRELWRLGVDTVHFTGGLATRFIRTGTALKKANGNSEKNLQEARAREFKLEAFDEYKRRFGMVPSRMLGILGLYFMRELEPDFALALTTEGAKKHSTLGNSKGNFQYDPKFYNIGFRNTDDPNWLIIPDFADGFYESLEKAKINPKEARYLHSAAESLKTMETTEQDKSGIGRLFEFASDESREVLHREIQAHDIWQKSKTR